MNEVGYEPAILPPPAENVHRTATQIKALQPEVGAVIDLFRGGGIGGLNLLGDAILEKGFDTDSYNVPTFVEPPLGEFIPVSAITRGTDITTSTEQVNPIVGTIELKWVRPCSPQNPCQAPFVTPLRVAVPANVLWVDTGVDLAAGQPFGIQASGKWSNVNVANPDKDANGFVGDFKDNALLPSANFASLIGRVGKDMFFVGEDFKGTSPSAGRLFLAMNDLPDTFADNQGVLAVNIFPR